MTTYWIYSYDALGQVVGGHRYWADGTPVDGQQFDYAFDDIGNRVTTGGRASAGSTYTVNRLNQYSQRTVADRVDVLGIANPTASVTVNGSTATRHGEYFHYPLWVANSSAAYPTVTIASTYGGGASASGSVFVPPSTESFTHDDDGNLTADGRWTYSWDGENRVVQMIRDTSSPSGARQKLVFEYDYQGRRIRKQFYTYSSGWVLQSDTAFLYDGWNLIAELDANSSNALLRAYLWGTDLSGSMQGAGGIGGLIKVTDYVGSTTHHFVAYDGNGNVGALVDAGSATITARYGYGPFGEALQTTGAMAKKMPFRFSTKYTDNESALVYYGYRFYNPGLGRWLSRDPVQEIRAYVSHRNEPTDRLDPLGLADVPDDIWKKDYDIQNPPPSDYNAATRVNYIINILDVDIEDCGCCFLKDANFKIQVKTKFSFGATVSTILHESVHAWGDWQLGLVKLPAALECMKKKCIPIGTPPSKADCRKALQKQIQSLAGSLEDEAYGQMNTDAHTAIGTVGWSQSGEETFMEQTGSALTDWEDKQKNCKGSKCSCW
jgi:RHS repeat-associated protein